MRRNEVKDWAVFNQSEPVYKITRLRFSGVPVESNAHINKAKHMDSATLRQCLRR